MRCIYLNRYRTFAIFANFIESKIDIYILIIINLYSIYNVSIALHNFIYRVFQKKLRIDYNYLKIFQRILWEGAG